MQRWGCGDADADAEMHAVMRKRRCEDTELRMRMWKCGYADMQIFGGGYAVNRICGDAVRMRRCGNTKMWTRGCGPSDAESRMRRCGCEDSEIWMQRYGCEDADAEMPMQRCRCGSKVRIEGAEMRMRKRRMRMLKCGDVDAEIRMGRCRNADMWMRICGCKDAGNVSPHIRIRIRISTCAPAHLRMSAYRHPEMRCGDVDAEMRRCGCGDAKMRVRRCGCGESDAAEAEMRKCGDVEMRRRRCGWGDADAQRCRC